MFALKNIEVSYGDKAVLKQLNIDLKAGEVHGILGMNGAGKTTLFNSIYGIKKINTGQRVSDLSKDDMGFLQTQNFFYPLMKGEEYLKLLGLQSGLDKIDEWNKVFDLPLDELVENYSTGMKKKLAFLAIILMKKKMLLLDEPFNGVDVESNEKIMYIIRKLRDNGTGIFISSHILSTLLQTADRISLLEKGSIQKTYSKASFQELEDFIKNRIKTSLDEQLKELI